MRLTVDLIPDPPECLIQGSVPLELYVEAPAAQTLGWILPAPTPFETAEKIAPQEALLLPPIYVQDKTAIMPGAGGALFANVIAPKPYVLPRYDQAMTVLAANQTFDSEYSIVGETPLPPSVPEPNFAGRDTPGPTAEIAPITFPRKELALNYFTSNLPVVEMQPAKGPASWDITADNTAWTMNGTTLDGVTGAAVSGVTVKAYRTGWQYQGGVSVIAETVSDGSGAFQIRLPNADHIVVGYKSGSPDQSGTTRNSATPATAQTVYMRDPTVLTPAGAGGGMSRSRVVNP